MEVWSESDPKSSEYHETSCFWRVCVCVLTSMLLLSIANLLRLFRLNKLATATTNLSARQSTGTQHLRNPDRRESG